MYLPTLIELFERDLLKVKQEVLLYPHASQLWEVRPGISNSAGNLTLHLMGNLQHFIGATLGNTGYIRHRDDEFALKDIPRDTLVSMLDDTISVVNNTLQQLSAADLESNYPLEKHGEVVTTTYMLLHLSTHLNYHLGQINYHRRLLTTQ
jgi:uncharacterized damage-inducible protein DinB